MIKVASENGSASAEEFPPWGGLGIRVISGADGAGDALEKNQMKRLKNSNGEEDRKRFIWRLQSTIVLDINVQSTGDTSRAKVKSNQTWKLILDTTLSC